MRACLGTLQLPPQAPRRPCRAGGCQRGAHDAARGRRRGLYPPRFLPRQRCVNVERSFAVRGHFCRYHLFINLCHHQILKDADFEDRQKDALNDYLKILKDRKVQVQYKREILQKVGAEVVSLIHSTILPLLKEVTKND